MSAPAPEPLPVAAYSGVLEISLAQDSKVEYFTVENWGPEVYAFNQRPGSTIKTFGTPGMGAGYGSAPGC